MNTSKAMRLGFYSLVWPIFVDHFLRVVVLVASYGLMSQISDEIAGMFGVINLYLLIGFTFSECLAQGGAIILTHYLGAKEKELGQFYSIMVLMSLLAGLFISVIFFSFSSSLLSSFGFSQTSLQDGVYYLSLVGSCFFIYSLNYAFLSILNAHGFTKYSMHYSLLVNGLSLLFYYMIAFFSDIFPSNRLVLIAWIQCFVRCVGMVFLLRMLRSLVPNFVLYTKIPWPFMKQHLSRFLRISLPNAIEPLSSQMFQFFLIKIIATIEHEALSVRSYLISLTTLFEIGIWSISRGNQIIVGHLVGANETEFVWKQLRKSIAVSFLLSVFILCFGLKFRYEFMHFFSHTESVVNIGAELLTLVAGLILIRTVTFNLQGGLRAAGDIKFGFTLAQLVMWGFTMPGAYIVTHFFKMGLQGIWIMLLVDESIRTVFLLQRWKSQKWKNRMSRQ